MVIMLPRFFRVISMFQTQFVKYKQEGEKKTFLNDLIRKQTPTRAPLIRKLFRFRHLQKALAGSKGNYSNPYFFSVCFPGALEEDCLGRLSAAMPAISNRYGVRTNNKRKHNKKETLCAPLHQRLNLSFLSLAV